MKDIPVVVICASCGRVAPRSTPDSNDPFGAFLWHQPCPNCGAENWAAHDTNRDWKSGRIRSQEAE